MPLHHGEHLAGLAHTSLGSSHPAVGLSGVTHFPFPDQERVGFLGLGAPLGAELLGRQDVALLVE